MTWKVFEEAENRVRAMQDQLSEKALAYLERKGLDVRGKSLAEIKKQIAAKVVSRKVRHDR
jgi:hypothetical protein